MNLKKIFKKMIKANLIFYIILSYSKTISMNFKPFQCTNSTYISNNNKYFIRKDLFNILAVKIMLKSNNRTKSQFVCMRRKETLLICTHAFISILHRTRAAILLNANY